MDRLLQRDKLQSDSSSEDVFLLANEEPKNVRKGTSTKSSIAVCLLAQQQLASRCHMLPGHFLIVNCLVLLSGLTAWSYYLIDSKLISPHLNTSYFLSLTESSPEVEKTSPGESNNC